jgi:hypothetical protein
VPEWILEISVGVGSSKRLARWIGDQKYEIILQRTLRRLPEEKLPSGAGFSFVFKARQQAHSRKL